MTPRQDAWAVFALGLICMIASPFFIAAIGG